MGQPIDGDCTRNGEDTRQQLSPGDYRGRGCFASTGHPVKVGSLVCSGWSCSGLMPCSARASSIRGTAGAVTRQPEEHAQGLAST